MKNILSFFFPKYFMTYERARKIAAKGSEQNRIRLAASHKAPAEVLYYLANDAASAVRVHVARNRATPHQADLILSEDKDEEVRCVLVEKIARTLPTLSPDQQKDVYENAITILNRLVNDHAIKVRHKVASEIKKEKNIPPAITQKLARDLDSWVASPVLEFSPLLSDEDLIEIINAATDPKILPPIARRRALSEKPADALVAREDEEAIACLLRNDSAQIREETLDMLAEKAPHFQKWHEPFVYRPVLPMRIAQKLTDFVAGSLLEALKSREDLDQETTAKIEKVIQEKGGAPIVEKVESGESQKQKILDDVKKLFKEGALTQDYLDEELVQGNQGLVTVALSVMARLPEDVVRRAISLKSSKGIAAICWRAGLSAQFALKIQIQLARLSPTSVLRPNNNGEYALSEEDLKWQLEFLADLKS